RALWPPQDTPGGQVLSEDGLERLLGPGLQRGPRTVLLFLQDQVRPQIHPETPKPTPNPPQSPRTVLAALHSAGSALSLPAVSGAAVAALPPTLQRLLGAPP
ncbi:VAS1 ATPase, partial [Origma solitaria]|nr:VAS1 ATPase [Origma solitaria]